MKRSVANSKPQPASFTSWAGKPILFCFFTSVLHWLFPTSFLFPQWPEKHFYIWHRIKSQALSTTTTRIFGASVARPGQWSSFSCTRHQVLVGGIIGLLWSVNPSQMSCFFSFIKAPGCHSGFFLFFELSTNTPPPSLDFLGPWSLKDVIHISWPWQDWKPLCLLLTSFNCMQI